MSNFLDNAYVEFGALDVALGTLPRQKSTPDTKKAKKARRGPSVSLLRGKLESSERMVRLLQEEIAVLRQHMAVENQVIADQKLYERRKHP